MFTKKIPDLSKEFILFLIITAGVIMILALLAHVDNAMASNAVHCTCTCNGGATGYYTNNILSKGQAGKQLLEGIGKILGLAFLVFFLPAIAVKHIMNTL